VQILASLNDPSRLGGSLDSALLADLQQASDDWAAHISGLGTLTVELQFKPLGGTTLAEGAPGSYTDGGTTLDGKTLVTPAPQHELSTGTHLGTASGKGVTDMVVVVSTDLMAQLYTGLDGRVPQGRYDAVSLFAHEIDHGLGENGFIGTPDSPRIESLYDHYVRIGADGSAVFTGPAAELVNGGPVTLTTSNSGEAYYHVANTARDTNARDLMSGLGLAAGTAPGISLLDLAILKDSGVPIAGTLVTSKVTSSTLSDGQSVAGSGGTDFIIARGTASVAGAAIGDVAVYAQGGTLTFTGGGSTATVVGQGAASLALSGGGAGSAMTAFGGRGDIAYHGGSGADEIIGGSGAFRGSGGAGGSLVLFGGAGTMRFSGGAESDTIVDGAGAATIAAGTGAVFAGTAGGSILSANGAGTFLAGNASGDQLSASAAGGDILAAGAGNETLSGSGSAEIDIDFGGTGSDLVLLGHGNDSFVGGTGAATVQAGSGNQTLYLGHGAPALLDFAQGLTGGSDTVSGFRVGTDHLHLAGYAGDPTLAAIGSGTVLGLSDGTRITLLGVATDSAAGLLA